MPYLYIISKALNLQTILTYYGLICLFSLPVSLAATVFIYKKRPATLHKIDAAVDRLFGDKPKEAPVQPQNPENEAQPEEKLTMEEQNEKYGIPTLMLTVGDRYKCVMSTKNRKDIGGTDFSWTVSDRFVGDIKDMQGIFTAKHVGEAYIESAVGRKQIYYVVVNPVHKDWGAADAVNAVIGTEDISNIKVQNIKSRILDLNIDKRFIVYQADGGMLSYEYGKDDAVRRALFTLHDCKDTRLLIADRILEYMSPLKKEQDPEKGPCYWYHKNDIDNGDFVDYVAFMKLSASGKLYFGIGECWRYGCTEDEILGNSLMVDRSFKNLIAPEDYPAAVGQNLNDEPTQEEKDGRMEMDKANNAGKADPQQETSGAPSQETPASEPEDEDRNETETTTNEEESPEDTTPQEDGEEDFEDVNQDDGFADETPEVNDASDDPMKGFENLDGTEMEHEDGRLSDIGQDEN